MRKSIDEMVHVDDGHEVAQKEPRFRELFTQIFGESPEPYDVYYCPEDLNVGPYVAFIVDGYRFLVYDDGEGEELFTYDYKEFRYVRKPSDVARMNKVRKEDIVREAEELIRVAEEIESESRSRSMHRPAKTQKLV